MKISIFSALYTAWASFRKNHIYLHKMQNRKHVQKSTKKKTEDCQEGRRLAWKRYIPRKLFENLQYTEIVYR